jgi:nicotinamidase/pyrazinamidase
MNTNAALLLVDVQNDFCPGGALPVANGDAIIAPLNLVVSRFAAAGLPVLTSRDWHPAQTRHFRAFGGVWPPHCIQGSHGADFHPGLSLPDATIVVSKGTTPDSDAYSAFEGRADNARSPGEILASRNIRTLYVGGLATDYCVRSSVLDALRAGFDVVVLTDAVAGVDLTQGDSLKALVEMQAAGASFCTSLEAAGRVLASCT